MATLANKIAAKVDSIVVFNLLNWKRDGEVTMDLPKDMNVVDHGSGQTIPYLVLSQDDHLRRVEFRAKDVPAVGYKVYELRKAAVAAPPPQAITGTIIESPFYRVVLDPSTGSIRSIYDKQLKKELVDKVSPWRFGQYLYVS